MLQLFFLYFQIFKIIDREHLKSITFFTFSIVITMGFFDKMNEKKNFRKTAEWRQGLIHTHIELNEDHLKIITLTETDIVFYKDIVEVQQVTRVVNIRTIRKTYSLSYYKLRGGGDKAVELQMRLLELMSENK